MLGPLERFFWIFICPKQRVFELGSLDLNCMLIETTK
jgi:hypothetical protein